MTSNNGRRSGSDNSIPGHLSRRRVLSALGATAAVSGLAGCNDGGGNGELGERVPQLTQSFWAGLGGLSSIHETLAPIIQQSVEGIGVQVNTQNEDVGSAVGDAYSDERSSHFQQWFYVASPERLDPGYMLRRFGIDWAGPEAGPNPANYANCEYTELAFEQGDATDPQERREIVNEALNISSHDKFLSPITASLVFQAARTDNINIRQAGKGGLQPQNIFPLLHSEPKDGDEIFIGTGSTGMETNNHLTHVSSTSINRWSHGIYTPLVAYNHNFELKNILAQSLNFSNNAQTLTVELKDASFHNGDPVTAEDVKFTFSHIWDNGDVYPQASTTDYDSIDVIDDSTVEFNFPEPTLDARTWSFPKWGILPRDVWLDQGMDENPEQDLSDVVGSGPFQVSRFDQGSVLSVEPAEGNHPMANPDHNVTWQVFSGAEPRRRAFQQGELHIIDSVNPSFANEVEEEIDNAELYSTEGFLPFTLNIQWPMVPNKFEALREAIGMSIDRQTCNEVALLGQSVTDTAASQLSPSHPFRPPDDELFFYTDDPTGDIEGAREVLSDAGFGWDDNDRLRYPPDANLEPLWPQGDTPADHPDEYPCLDNGLGD